MKSAALLVALYLAGAAGGAPPAPKLTTETDSEIRFSNRTLELRFSRENGRWISLYDRTSRTQLMAQGGHLASVLLTTDGRRTAVTWKAPWPAAWSQIRLDQSANLLDTTSIGPGLRLTGWHEETSGGMVWLTLETAEGNWHIQQLYGMQPGGSTITRRIRLTWNGEGETLLRFADLRTPCPEPLANSILEAPGYPAVLHERLDQLPAGPWPELDRGDVPGNRAGLLVFRHGDSNVLVWGFDNAIPSQMSVSRGDWGVWISQRLLSSCRLHKGQTLEAGSPYLRLEHGDFREALARFRHFWDDAGARRVGATPSWGMDARIYEVHIGPNRWGGPYNPYPDLPALVSDLPRIAALGFDIVQLMPRQPYPDYAVHDYRDIATQYAPEADLRKMVDRAHELGLKVLLDVVMHGVIDKRSPTIVGRFDVHPYLTQHPDWFSY